MVQHEVAGHSDPASDKTVEKTGESARAHLPLIELVETIPASGAAIPFPPHHKASGQRSERSPWRSILPRLESPAPAFPFPTFAPGRSPHARRDLFRP